MSRTRPPIIYPVFKLLALLPLSLVHALGWLLGWLQYFTSREAASLLRENLEESGVCRDDASLRRTLRQNVGESGKGLLETFAVWQRDATQVLSWVRHCNGWDAVEAAYAEGKGIIFLTPHLGCFEITSLHIATTYPITILYRPPKQKWLLPLIQAGRARGKATLAPATTRGVRDLLQALKRKETVGILPDQIPAKGEGEWAPFFGRAAYTMTLASRLAEKTGAAVIMVFGERLPRGRGFHLHFTRLPDGAINTVEGLNRAIETQVRQCPQQYLWSYNRYKVRRRAKPLDETNEA